MPAFLLVVTEGLLEIPVAKKVLTTLGIDQDQTRFYPKGGKDAFWRDAQKYNRAALHVGPILGIADLEQQPCVPGLIEKYIPRSREQNFVLRVAERMLESWLLADREALARYLYVPVGRVPADPDSLPNPKLELVNLARQSRRRRIFEDLVPKQGGQGVVGRGYTPVMTAFIDDFWRPRVAAGHSSSLMRALNAIERAVA